MLKTVAVYRPVKIKSFLDQREISVCVRLREARLAARFDQPTLAAMLGISRVRLASYEYAKAPVRSDIGLKACEALDISQRWLATGRRPMFGFVRLSDDTSVMMKPRELFLAAYNRLMKPVVDAAYAMLDQSFGEDFMETGDLETRVMNPKSWAKVDKDVAAVFWMDRTLRLLCFAASSVIAREYAIELGELNQKFFARRRDRIIRSIKDALNADNPKLRGHECSGGRDNESLTQAETSSSVGSVKSQLPNLLEELKKATAEPGKKTALAEFLSKVSGRAVPLASVSRWLSGEREPGGEIVLQMQAWLKRPNQ